MIYSAEWLCGVDVVHFDRYNRRWLRVEPSSGRESQTAKLMRYQERYHLWNPQHLTLRATVKEG